VAGRKNKTKIALALSVWLWPSAHFSCGFRSNQSASEKTTSTNQHADNSSSSITQPVRWCTSEQRGCVAANNEAAARRPLPLSAGLTGRPPAPCLSAFSPLSLSPFRSAFPAFDSPGDVRAAGGVHAREQGHTNRRTQTDRQSASEPLDPSPQPRSFSHSFFCLCSFFFFPVRVPLCRSPSARR
jgi:hypothetical protein